ncbi:MAG: hypothetical protein RLZZ403_716 [Pseudomonadota bacterium]|jgi:hypothetical protein
MPDAKRRRRSFLIGIGAVLLAMLGFIVWQNVDPAVGLSKAALSADEVTRARFGEIGFLQLVGYTNARPSSDRSGYREYRWYVWGSQSAGRVDVVATHETPAAPLK